MHLRAANENDCIYMMPWFQSEELLSSWAGPGISFPFTSASFLSALKLNDIASRVLTNREGEFLAFGQYYSRLGRCHLGRLVVHPDLRGRGISHTLLELLIKEGKTDIGATQASLFVLNDNHAAKCSYEKFGFEEAEYPEPINFPNCIYMTKSVA